MVQVVEWQSAHLASSNPSTTQKRKEKKEDFSIGISFSRSLCWTGWSFCSLGSPSDWRPHTKEPPHTLSGPANRKINIWAGKSKPSMLLSRDRASHDHKGRLLQRESESVTVLAVCLLLSVRALAQLLPFCHWATGCPHVIADCDRFVFVCF
jgi:hypothetical protein